ncbi:hypothetical protein ACWC8S_19995, partial [Streptomyces fungicidicus]
MRTFFAFDFFAGRRPRRPGGGSSGAARRLRCGGTSGPDVSRSAVSRSGAPRRDRHIAVYMDLLKADIGHAEPPEGIWRVLLA